MTFSGKPFHHPLEFPMKKLRALCHFFLAKFEQKFFIIICHTLSLFVNWLCTLAAPNFLSLFFIASFHLHAYVFNKIEFPWFFFLFKISLRFKITEMHCIRESFIAIDAPFSLSAAFYECYVAVIHSTIRYEVIRKLMKTPDKFILSDVCCTCNDQNIILYNKKEQHTIIHFFFFWCWMYEWTWVREQDRRAERKWKAFKKHKHHSKHQKHLHSHTHVYSNEKKEENKQSND